MEKFTYKNYKNCYFNVGSYLANKKAMAISIENKTEGPIATCTIFTDTGIYSENFITVKNYSENSYMTDFLQKLGVVIDILDRVPCNEYVRDTILSENPQTIDTCFIDSNVYENTLKSGTTMFNKFKNNELVIVNGFGKYDNKKYCNRLGKIICRDPYYFDYNVKFEDGTEDWIDEIYISKLEGE